MKTRYERIRASLQKRLDQVNAEQRRLLKAGWVKDDPRFIRLDCNVQALVEMLRLVELLEA